MSDEARELIRAAQEAEIAGDRKRAAELLVLAADRYRESGRTARAVAALKHALRLDPARRVAQAELAELEGTEAEAGSNGPQPAMPPVLLSPPRQAPAVSDRERPVELVERGPTLAPPDAEAWCSFCCRPARDVGPLVAGPAGAFVCAGCAGDALEMLGPSSPNDESQAPREAAEAVPEAAVRGGLPSSPQDDHGLADFPRALPGAQSGDLADLPHQTEALSQLVRAVEQGNRRILLLGPSGSGKTALLRAIALRTKVGALVQALRPEKWPQRGLLLIDGADGLDDLQWAELARALDLHPDPVVLALRGRTPEPTYFILTETTREHLPSSQSLVTATGGKLPLGIAEAADYVAALEAPNDDVLCQLAKHLLAGRVREDLRDGLAQSLADLASSSGRGAHELVALVRRVPPGAQRVDEPGGYRGRRKTKKKVEPQ